MFNPCFLIPCYNHGFAIKAVIKQLQTQFNYPIIVVDDGSDQATKRILNELKDGICIVTLSENSGKGAAVIAGIKFSLQSGFSHAIQIDADGQHDQKSLPLLIETSKKHLTAIVSGRPIYDKSVPKGRYYGRYLTHIWVWIETLSFSIKDSMCGFRSYPVSALVKVFENNSLGTRMDFDTEVMVKSYWSDIDILFIETKVIYPENGLSHFQVFDDNLRITKMHTLLFFGMLKRLPKLLTRKQRKRHIKNGEHWSKKPERGTYYGMKLLLSIYSILGRGVFSLVLKPISLYYRFFDKEISQASALYLANLQTYAVENNIELPKKLTVANHIHSFSVAMLNKLASWKGDFSEDNFTRHNLDVVERAKQRKQGCLIIGSHLGNLELFRAFNQSYGSLVINALVFTDNSAKFSAIIEAINPGSSFNLIQISQIDPSTAILLAQKLERGEWIVIVGDRTSTTNENKVIWTDFLGKPAPFAQGPFLLASILKVPVYLLFGLRNDKKKKPHFDLYLENFSEQIVLPRGKRQEALQEVVDQYAQRLQDYTLKAPLQWYNFFNFWQLANEQGKRENNNDN
jgi:predicted LPLAT superfamily acyltransferase